MNWEESLSIERPHLLLVEGRDETGFFGAYIKYLNLSNIQIIETGKTEFKRRIKILPALPNFDQVRSIGIVRDADDNAKSAFDSICSSLKLARLPIPEQVLVSTPGSPHITILIMPPDGEGTGRMLEDVCFASVTQDKAIECVNQYIACLHKVGISHRTEVIAKARIHAFLTSRYDPDKRLGEAAQAGYWNFDAPVFDKVKIFLRQVGEMGTP